MATYEITFTTTIGGEMTERVEATSRDMAVVQATVSAIVSLEEMTRELGPIFGVEFGEATEGFALVLESGDVTLSVTELAGA